MDRFKFYIPRKKEYVSCARLTVTSIAAVAGFDIEKVEDIRLAVGEACNNAVLHSNGSDSIEISLEFDNPRITISVKDDGDGFVLDRENEELDKEYNGSGLGIYIIKSLMDDVNIVSEKNLGTCITMVKEI